MPTNINKKLILLSFFFFLHANAQTTVTTLAGSGAIGNVDGSGTAAQFNELYGMAVDASGNVFVADLYNSNIRKITPTGVVTTIAGHGSSGYVDGTGTSAYFNHPSGMAIDASGNIFVADVSNCRIRKITSAGVVSTLAGSGAFAFADGMGTEAQFYEPNDVAVDASGNVYVADTNNNRIRKITPAGMVSTLSGSTPGYVDGPAAAAKFNQPKSIAVDAAGNIFVAESTRIRKITTNGVVSTLAGGSNLGFVDGTGLSAKFSVALGVDVDASGNVFVADAGNHSIRKITSSGEVSTWAGNGTFGFADGTGTTARFFFPRSLAGDAAGTLYVADSYNYRVRKIAGTLGTDTYPLENQISFYPNPATSEININLEDTTTATIMISDMNGRVLKTDTIVENKSLMDISNLTNGIYLMQIATAKGIVRKKIVKN